MQASLRYSESCSINPIQDRGGRGEGQKAPPTSFSPVTLEREELAPPKFLTFSFKLFAILV